MHVKIITLVDITETKARRGDDKKLLQQQSNFMVFTQTIGLRVNPIPLNVTSEVANINELGFGKNHTGKQRYWTYDLEHEYFGGLTKEMLLDDFDLIPIVTGLNETASINNSVIRTKDSKECNTVFILADN
jgi:hypothetical protein